MIMMKHLFSILLVVVHVNGLAFLPPTHPESIAMLLHDTAQLAHLSGMKFSQEVATSYLHALNEHPLPTKMATGAVLATTGDAIAQARDVEQPFDKSRSASFALFDMSYRALQHGAFPWITDNFHGQFVGAFLYTIDFAHLFSFATSDVAAFERTLVNQLIIVPFLYYPCFFLLTSFMQGLSMEEGMGRARKIFLPLMARNLLFWLPVQFVQFRYVPEELQVPFVCAAGLCWTIILSISAGSTKGYGQTALQQTTLPAPEGIEDDEGSRVMVPGFNATVV